MALTLTALEQDVLRGIYASEFADGSDRPYIWSNAIRPQQATRAQIPGVVSSLVKKGLLISEEYDRGDRTVSVTAKGAALARDYGLIP